MNLQKVVCTFLLSFLFIQASPAQSQSPLLIIGQQKETMDQYVDAIGTPDGFMFYTSIQAMDGLSAPADRGAGVQYAQSYVAKYPKAVIQLAIYMKGALQDTLEGKYDANIEKLAKWIKKSKRTIYLRIGYEFDLPDNQYASESYKQVFRYIVVRLRAQQVKNVYYVWHSAVMVTNPGDFMDYYPGDKYVDIFGISFFNPQQSITAELFFELAKDHQKPVMISESTPAGMYTLKGKKSWYQKYFEFIRTHDIKIVSYINSNWDKLPMFKKDSWGDARVQQNIEIKEEWLKFIQQFRK